MRDVSREFVTKVVFIDNLWAIDSYGNSYKRAVWGRMGIYLPCNV
jgi:hypothetical protein